MIEDADRAPGRPLPQAGGAEVGAGASMVSAGSNAELDLRELAAPEPMLRALAATDAMSPGTTLTVLTPMVPTPLLHMLASRGLDARAQRLPDGSACVIIRRLPADGRAADTDDDGQARP